MGWYLTVTLRVILCIRRVRYLWLFLRGQKIEVGHLIPLAFTGFEELRNIVGEEEATAILVIGFKRQ